MISEAYTKKKKELQRELETIKYRLEIQRNEREKNSQESKNNDWRRTYDIFRNYEDEDELQQKLERLEASLCRNETSLNTNREACCSQDRSEERRVANLSLKKRIEEMRLYRTEGNRCYGDKNFEGALKHYEKCLLLSEYSFTNKNSSSLNLSQFQEEKVSCLLNCAACHMARHDFSQAICYCNEVLDLTQGSNIKALYKLCKCHRNLMDFESAQRCLQNLKASLEGENTSYVSIMEKEEILLKKAIYKYQNDSKIMALRMIQTSRKSSSK